MRLNGTVKFFNYERGFGFIAPDNGEKDVFVHTSALPQSGVSALKEGDKVSFETEDDTRGRGKKAAKVERSAQVEQMVVRSKWRPAERGRHS